MRITVGYASNTASATDALLKSFEEGGLPGRGTSPVLSGAEDAEDESIDQDAIVPRSLPTKARGEKAGDRRLPTKKGAGGEGADEEDEDGDHIEADENTWQGVVAFRCGHIFHRSCVPETACVICFEQNFASVLSPTRA
jgi:hypothetical protein